MRRILTLLLCLGLATSVTAQEADSARCGQSHAFTWSQTVAPATLFASGSLIAFTPLHNSIDAPLHTWSQQDGHTRFEIENYVQYAPHASVFLLKACGLESQHRWRDLVCLEGGASLLGFVLITGIKYSIREERPYPGVYNSFPSGHTATAFLGAEILRREYGEEYPAVAIAGYTVATGVGLMRIYNNRHWPCDVLAGAGIGILSASIMYWLSPYLRF